MNLTNPASSSKHHVLQQLFDGTRVAYFDAQFEAGQLLPPLPPVPSSYKNHDTIEKWKKEKVDGLRAVTAQLPFYGRCVSVAASFGATGSHVFDGNVVEFFSWLEHYADRKGLDPKSMLYVGFDVRLKLYLTGMALPPNERTRFLMTWLDADNADPYELFIPRAELRNYLPIADVMFQMTKEPVDVAQFETSALYRMQLAHQLVSAFIR